MSLTFNSNCFSCNLGMVKYNTNTHDVVIVTQSNEKYKERKNMSDLNKKVNLSDSIPHITFIKSPFSSRCFFWFKPI